MHYLYSITDTLNNKIYVGQTINPNRRWSHHKTQSKKLKPLQYIHRAIKKYNIDNFQFEIIATCKTQEDADETERQLIKQYDSRNKKKGYNRAPGGDVAWESGLPPHTYSMYGKHHTEISKEKIRIALVGNAKPTDVKIKMSLAAIKRNANDVSNVRTTGKKWKRMTLETAKKIRDDYHGGNVSFMQLANKYNCSVGNISLIINNKTHQGKNDTKDQEDQTLQRPN